MEHESRSLYAILDKMDTIALEHFDGKTSENIYSIYMRLDDLEKIQFAKHSYLFCKAILSVTSVSSCSNARSGCYSGDGPLAEEDRGLEVTDKRELVRMKHNAILAVSKVIFGVLCALFAGMMLMTFMSPSTIKNIGKMSTLIGVMFGG